MRHHFSEGEYVTMCKLVGFNRSLGWSSVGLFVFVCFIQSICWACYFQSLHCYLFIGKRLFKIIFICWVVVLV